MNEISEATEKVMCDKCKKKQYYYVEKVFFNHRMTGSGREYTLVKAMCVKCHHIVKVPSIIENNVHQLMYGNDNSIEMTESIYIGERIKELRHEKSMKQTVLAEKAGIDIRFLSKIEKGKIHINNDLLIRFAEIFNVPLRELSFLY